MFTYDSETRTYWFSLQTINQLVMKDGLWGRNHGRALAKRNVFVLDENILMYIFDVYRRLQLQHLNQTYW